MKYVNISSLQHIHAFVIKYKDMKMQAIKKGCCTIKYQWLVPNRATKIISDLCTLIRAISNFIKCIQGFRWCESKCCHGVDPLSYFLFQPVLHDWCNKGRGMCYPVCGMVHIKEPLLLNRKSSSCGGSRFPLSLSVWSFTI